MTSTAISHSTPAPPAAGTPPASLPLLPRLMAVVFAPHDAYRHVAGQPRTFGALAVSVALLIGSQCWFLSTGTGQDALLDQQVRGMEAFGMTVTDEIYAGLERTVALAPFTTAGYLLVAVPLMTAVMAGLLVGVFGVLMGGSASFRHAFAVTSHAGFIPALASLVTTPVNYLRGEMSSPLGLGPLVPMVPEDSPAGQFIGTIDLLLVWWTVNLAIGVAVLYRYRTGPVAWAFLAVYLIVCAGITAVRLMFR